MNHLFIRILFTTCFIGCVLSCSKDNNARDTDVPQSVINIDMCKDSYDGLYRDHHASFVILKSYLCYLFHGWRSNGWNKCEIHLFHPSETFLAYPIIRQPIMWARTASISTRGTTSIPTDYNLAVWQRFNICESQCIVQYWILRLMEKAIARTYGC